MTIKQCYEACLIELDKVQAPSLLLEDFNYLFNKAIQKYFNKRYSLFEANQQLTDDLRVLSNTVKLTEDTTVDIKNRAGDGHAFKLPNDYVHLLNCICEFSNTGNNCDTRNTTYQIGANKLTSNEWSQIITNYYMRPSVKQPYYYITNINTPISSNIPVDRVEGMRYGNSNISMLEIKCGILPSGTKLNGIYIEYLRAPEYVKLEIEELDKIEDDSYMLEFPDYVIYEIINEMVTSVLENNKDPRVQTFPVVNNTIAAPAKR